MTGSYEIFLNERQRLLDLVPNNLEIQAKIIKQLKKNMKASKGDYFDLHDLLNIPEVKKYFQFIAITGDRNIGKTTAMRNYIVSSIVPNNEEYIWLRGKDIEVKTMLPQEDQVFFRPKGWEYTKDSGTVWEDKEAKTKKDTSRIIGHYKAVNNIQNLKSVEFPKVSTIFYDEFNTDDTIKDKFTKLVQFITTVERQKKNMQVILAANYISQNDEILLKLGLGQEYKKKQPLLIFNWIAGAIMWNIPKGHYLNAKVKNTLGYRLSYLDFNTFNKQYAGTFKDDKVKNIIDMDKIISKVPLFNIFYEKELYTIFAFSKTKDKAVIVNDEYFAKSMNVPTYVFTKKDSRIGQGLPFLPYNKAKALLSLWNKEKFFATTSYEYNMILEMFEETLKENKPLVSYIE